MKEIIKKVLKKVKLRSLILLIILLMFNSYAWFIYATRVDGSLTAHVASWNVSFEAGEDEISTNVKFDVDKAYPGMETYTKTITARNKGEKQAVITYEIKSVSMFGTKYETNDEITSDDLKELLVNAFPFHIVVNSTSDNLDAENGQADVSISFEWPYESGNDEGDTQWGETAYEYYTIHPDETCISVELEIKAVQV